MSRLPKVFVHALHLKGPGPCVILFHGFTGTPYDLSPLAYFLHAQGCDVHVPLLLGHGTTPADLASVTAHAWLAQARNYIATHTKQPLFLGGLSMGALLALLAFTKKNPPRGFILISPSLRLTLSAELTVSAAKLGILGITTSIAKMGGYSDINDPEAKELCPSYHEMPVSGIMQLEELRKKAKKALAAINIPMFAGFGALDGAINTLGSRNVLLQSPAPLFIKTYSRSKHIVPLDYDRDELNRDVWQFIDSQQERP